MSESDDHTPSAVFSETLGLCFALILGAQEPIGQAYPPCLVGQEARG